MTGTIYLYTDDKQEGKAAAEWTDLDNNRFFYNGTQQKDAPSSGTAAVGAVYKSIKNETGYILVAITNKEKGIQVIPGSTSIIDLDGALFFCVLPNTTCSSTGQNWAIGLGVVLGVVIIVIIALFMSGVIVFHEGTGAGFGYNQR
jgi:hypothetical protein